MLRTSQVVTKLCTLFLLWDIEAASHSRLFLAPQLHSVQQHTLDRRCWCGWCYRTLSLGSLIAHQIQALWNLQLHTAGEERERERVKFTYKELWNPQFIHRRSEHSCIQPRPQCKFFCFQWHACMCTYTSVQWSTCTIYIESRMLLWM